MVGGATPVVGVAGTVIGAAAVVGTVVGAADVDGTAIEVVVDVLVVLADDVVAGAVVDVVVEAVVARGAGEASEPPAHADAARPNARSRRARMSVLPPAARRFPSCHPSADLIIGRR